MATRKALTAPEIRSRLEDMGAKTRATTAGSFLVYPKDQAADRPPVKVPGRIRGGNELPNIVAQLRRSGWDLYPNAATAPECAARPHPSREEDTAMSTPAAMPKRVTLPPLKLPTGTANADLEEKIDTLFTLLAEVEKRLPAEGALSGLRRQVDTLEANRDADAREDARQINALRGDLAAALKRIAALEAAAPAAAPTGKSISQAEQTRRDVLAFFESMPRGIKFAPDSVRENIGYPKVVDGKPSTAVAAACGELVEKGLLQGGGSRKLKRSTSFGLYWLPAEESAETGAA